MTGFEVGPMQTRPLDFLIILAQIGETSFAPFIQIESRNEIEWEQLMFVFQCTCCERV